MTSEANFRPSRRTLVKGAAWSVPVMAVAAAPAYAGVSLCTVNDGAIQIDGFTRSTLTAVCTSNSQSGDLYVPRIHNNYGYVYGPTSITICNCKTDARWFRFRETDTLSNFQIEVDGRHNDQNSSTAGYRPAFRLAPVNSDTGSCQVFPLTYRTSATRPYYNTTTAPNGADSANMLVELQVNNSTSSTPPTTGWTTLQTFNVQNMRVWRTTSTNVNFERCRNQGSGSRMAQTSDAAAEESEVAKESSDGTAD